LDAGNRTIFLSRLTIESHRKNIRRKLGIQHKKANLRSHLVSIESIRQL